MKKTLKLSVVKVRWNKLFQALGIIESKTVWETVLAWSEIKERGGSNTGEHGLRIVSKISSPRIEGPRQTSIFDFIRRRP